MTKDKNKELHWIIPEDNSPKIEIIKETKPYLTIRNMENGSLDIQISDEITMTEAAEKFFEALQLIAYHQTLANKEFSSYYRNHRGEIAWRNIIPKGIWFGKTEWHPQEQWFVKAEDTRDGKTKDFALSDFLGDNDPREPHP